MARSRKPGLTAAVACGFGVVLALVGVLVLVVGHNDGSMVGPGACFIVMAVLSGVLGVLGFRTARGDPGASAMAGPTALVTVLLFLAGFAGAALGIIFGALAGSFTGVGLGVVAFVVGLGAAIQGVLLYGSARHAAESPSPRV